MHSSFIPGGAIFDMDGLMLDTEPMYKRAWQKAGTQCGFDLADEFYFTLIGRNEEECERLLFQKFGTDFPIVRFQDLWQSNWEQEAETNGIRKKPGLSNLLDKLEASKVPMAVATSSGIDYATKCLSSSGLEHRFGHIVTGDQIERSKPAPDIFVEAAKRLDVKPATCIAFEDSAAGVQAAAAAGMRVFMVPDLLQPTEETKSLAYKVVASLDDVLDEIQP